MKIKGEIGGIKIELPDPGLIEHDGEFFEAVEYRPKRKGDLFTCGALDYWLGTDISCTTYPVWILRSITRPYLDHASNYEQDGDKPTITKLGDWIWDNGIVPICDRAGCSCQEFLGKYRWHLRLKEKKQEPEKHTSCEGCKHPSPTGFCAEASWTGWMEGVIYCRNWTPEQPEQQPEEMECPGAATCSSRESCHHGKTHRKINTECPYSCVLCGPCVPVQKKAAPEPEQPADGLVSYEIRANVAGDWVVLIPDSQSRPLYEFVNRVDFDHIETKAGGDGRFLYAFTKDDPPVRVWLRK